MFNGLQKLELNITYADGFIQQGINSLVSFRNENQFNSIYNAVPVEQVEERSRRRNRRYDIYYY